MLGRVPSFARLALLVLALPLGGCGASSLAAAGPAPRLHDDAGLGPLPVSAVGARKESVEPARLRDLDPHVERKVVVVASSGRLPLRANDCPACRIGFR